jgi:hypothetical protein
MGTWLLLLALQLSGSGPSLSWLDLQTAFDPVSREAASRGIAMTLAYETGRQGMPITSQLDRRGICIVTVSADDDGYRTLRALVSGVASSRRQAFLEAVLAHELAHCEQFALARRDFRGSALVDPQRQSSIRSYADLRAHWGADDLTLWVELYADVAAGIYLQRAHPDACEEVMHAVLDARRRYAEADRGHATAIYFGEDSACRAPARGESPLEAAIRIRGELVLRRRAGATFAP